MKKTIFIQLILLLISISSFSQAIRKDTIYFEFNSASLDSNSEYSLELLAKILAKAEYYQIQISGHADSIGNDNYNLILSEKRAESVKIFLTQNDLKGDLMKIYSYGRKKPAFSNLSEDFEDLNRRVEIVSTFKPSPKKVMVDTTVKKITYKFENDTIIQGAFGTELVIKSGTFYPNKIRNIDFEIKEALTRGQMILQDLETIDVNGNCLSSGGMVSLSAKFNGQPTQPNADSAIIVRIPADKFNSGMKIYKVNDSTGTNSWEETNIEISFDSTGNRFYEFKTPILANYNVDMIPGVNEATNLVSKLQQRVKEEKEKLKEIGLVVKSKKYRYVDSYLTSEDILMLSKGKRIQVKKVLFAPCSIRNNNVFIATFESNGILYLVNMPLTDLKYRSFFNRYVVKKKDYIRMSKEEIEEELAKL